MKKVLTILTGLILLFTLGASTGMAAATNDGIDKKNKVINLAGYDACTGKYGDYGLDDKRGQEIAIEEINAAGGIASGPLKGYTLKLDFFDDRGDPKESANVAKKISSGKYIAALGPTMSSCALAATPIYNRYGLANIITYSNASTITEQGFNNLIRLTYTTKSIADFMITTSQGEFKSKTISIISENADYGQQLRKYAMNKAKEIGLKVVTDDVITPGQDVDFSSVLLRAKNENPDILLLFVTYNEGGMIAKQVRKMDWNVTLYGPDSLTAPKFFELAGNLDNIYITSSMSLDLKKPVAEILVADFTKKYGVLPPLSAIYGYDAVKVAVQIIEKGGVDRASFIAKLKDVKVPGVGSPMYQFDEKGEGLAPPLMIKTAQWHKDQQK
ncbi:MAG: ABC transporter substrate-binding protein [Proteobacteria bacterium]|nr:ABC transporter substrate-binding protein [Pseudomonadota bacterium]MBU1695491.1 ABC transporter substrate-binding protein [Pseudomonadota bacterium]